MSKKKLILLEGLPKIKPVGKLILGVDREEKRVRIPSDTRKAVYDRAKKRCECCGMPLRMSQGEFHHLKKPITKPRPSNLQFLCPTHHKLGHKWKTRTQRTMLETKKVPNIVRKKVRKHPSSPYWREKPKTTKKKPTTRKTKKATRTRKKAR